ncbi:biotin transporter BioY [Shumkonia mesophila]|uniref:biotin transporter BioY n=1 Tax=Shumkonia mesophila TaxID=2838854 RepID=UPI002934CBF6|nr:biotin transporter BioY [Shumkonia mesophila]
MRGPTTVQPTLISAVWSAAGAGWLRAAILAVVGSLLLTASAKILVPFWPVPMTMQTFAVLVIGMAYGPRLGVATVALYLAQGALGLPVFAGTPEKGIGLAYMVGPTGGYLVGYLLAATACGYLAERGWDRGLFTTAAALVIGNVILFLPGVLWLGVLFGWSKPILAWGLTPFLLGEATKMALAAVVIPLAWKAVRSRRH